MNNRRKLVFAFGAGALAAPFGSLAQQPGKIWRVGFLSLRRIESLDSDFYGAFPRGMSELGYVEGKNLVIDWRSADGKAERLSGLAAELLQLKPDVIVVGGSQPTRAAQKATTTIPIVMGSTDDPVGSGFVKSLALPGGNITGLSNTTSDVSSKHLEMLLSVVPKLSRMAVLVNYSNLSHASHLKRIQAAAQTANIKTIHVEARTLPEIEGAFSKMRQERAEGLILAADALFTQQRRQITELAAKHRLPAVFPFREYVDIGGLMSYGQSWAAHYMRAATYVDKILKGAQPGNLPVEQSMTFEMIINRKTAKALGLTIPQSLLILADKVID